MIGDDAQSLAHCRQPSAIHWQQRRARHIDQLKRRQVVQPAATQQLTKPAKRMPADLAQACLPKHLAHHLDTAQTGEHIDTHLIEAGRDGYQQSAGKAFPDRLERERDGPDARRQCQRHARTVILVGQPLEEEGVEPEGQYHQHAGGARHRMVMPGQTGQGHCADAGTQQQRQWKEVGRCTGNTQQLVQPCEQKTPVPSPGFAAIISQPGALRAPDVIDIGIVGDDQRQDMQRHCQRAEPSDLHG